MQAHFLFPLFQKCISEATVVLLSIREASKPAQLSEPLHCFLLAMTNAITPEGILK